MMNLLIGDVTLTCFESFHTNRHSVITLSPRVEAWKSFVTLHPDAALTFHGLYEIGQSHGRVKVYEHMDMITDASQPMKIALLVSSYTEDVMVKNPFCGLGNGHFSAFSRENDMNQAFCFAHGFLFLFNPSGVDG